MAEDLSGVFASLVLRALHSRGLTRALMRVCSDPSGADTQAAEVTARGEQGTAVACRGIHFWRHVYLLDLLQPLRGCPLLTS